MAASVLAAAWRALQQLFCPAAAQDDGAGVDKDGQGAAGGGGGRLSATEHDRDRARARARQLGSGTQNDDDDQDEDEDDDDGRRLRQRHQHPHQHQQRHHHHRHDSSGGGSCSCAIVEDAAADEPAPAPAPAPPSTVTMGDYVADKENVAPDDGHGLTAALGRLGLSQKQPLASATAVVKDRVRLAGEHVEVLREREQNLRFIGEALEMARLALRTNETPVGCVIVHNGQIIAKGMNATNVTRNGTRHAELMAISALLSVRPDTGPRTTSLRRSNQPPRPPRDDDDDLGSSFGSRRLARDTAPPDQGNEDGSKGHLYPYGQKLHPGARVDPRILHDSMLYVTVEPCVMCASLLRQFGIKKVYFGAVNDKFGGTGGVFSIHANSLPVTDGAPTASAHPMPVVVQRPSQLPDGSGTLGTSYPPGGGDGGNVEHGYEIEGGWGRDEAVGLLRRFYVQENGRAPVPRKKEGRAARLAAMIEKDGSVEAAADGADAAAQREAAAGDDVDDDDDDDYDEAATTTKATMATDGQPSPGLTEDSRRGSCKEKTATHSDEDDDKDKAKDDDDGAAESEASSDDDDVDAEFYLGLAERSRQRGNYARR